MTGKQGLYRASARRGHIRDALLASLRGRVPRGLSLFSAELLDVSGRRIMALEPDPTVYRLSLRRGLRARRGVRD